MITAEQAPGIELLPRDAQRCGEFCVREALGVSFEEIEPLALLDAPVQVYSSISETGTPRFDVTIGHNPLDGLDLLNFLKTIAPEKPNNHIEGILGDWDIINPANQERNSFNRDLAELHAKLGTSWEEFAKSQPAFYHPLEDAKLPYSLYDNGYWSGTPKLIPEERAKQMENSTILSGYAKSAPPTLEDMVEKLRAIGIEVDEEALLGKAKNVINNGRLKKTKNYKPIRSPDALRRKFMGWPKSQRRAFFRSFVYGLSDDERKKILEVRNEEIFDSVELADEAIYCYPRRLLDAPLAEVCASSTTVREGAYEGEFIELTADDGEKCQVLLPKSTRYVGGGRKVAPLISWQRDETGKRQFIFERAPQPSTEEVSVDGVLGALAVAYFSPEIRKEWPKHLGIGDSRKQFMGAAQVPVLALMRRAQLLKSPFIEQAEAIAA